MADAEAESLADADALPDADTLAEADADADAQYYPGYGYDNNFNTNPATEEPG